jgi:hypothetical protein
MPVVYSLLQAKIQEEAAKSAEEAEKVGGWAGVKGNRCLRAVGTVYPLHPCMCMQVMLRSINFSYKNFATC